MITNAQALRTDLPPQSLKHRDGKLHQLSRALAPIEDGEPGMDACIFGPSGTGKTALARPSTSTAVGHRPRAGITERMPTPATAMDVLMSANTAPAHQHRLDQAYRDWPLRVR